MFYRAFYVPDRGSYDEKIVDANDLDQLPDGAILIIKVNEDGTRELHHNEAKKRSLTPKESDFHGFAHRHLEFKHDGGDTPAIRRYKNKKRGISHIGDEV